MQPAGPMIGPGMGAPGMGGPMPGMMTPQHQPPQPGWPPGQQTLQSPVAGATRTARATRATPQVIALVVVGAVCLAIFVVGVYLFFTTKF
jgi:hypothetical protein